MSKKKKTYKKKYTTKDRLDMSKGGRVGYQKGKKVAVDPRTGKALPRKSIERPIAVGGPARPNPNLGGPRRGASPTLPERKLNQVGNPLPELSQAEKDRRQKLAQARIDANKKLMEQNPFKPVIQNLDNQRIDSPKPTQPMPKDRVPPKQPPMSVGGVGGGRIMTGREELELANQSVSGNQPKEVPQRQVPKKPNFVGAKGSDQMFIGRTDQETRIPQAAQAQTTQTAQTTAFNVEDTGGAMSREDFFRQYGDYDGPTRGSAAGRARDEYNEERDRAYEDYLRSLIDSGDSGGGTYTPPSDGSVTGTPAQAEQERRERGIRAGRTAEQIAVGQIPEGTIPSAEAVKIMERQPDETQEEYEARIASMEAEAVEMEGVAPIEAATIAQQAPEQVAQIQAKTGKTPEEIQTALTTAATITESPEVQAAIGELSSDSIAKLEEIRDLSGPAVAAQISDSIANAAKAEDVDGVLSAGAFVPEVTGVNVQVSETPDAEKQEREAITGEAASGEAAQIIGQVGYEAAKQRAVKGTAAKGAAANMIAETAELPPDIAAAVVEDPATVEAQIDTEPVEVQAAVAALPQEALVSSQIETLLGGMEDGEVPMWAKPAVDKVNSMLAQRGMSASTVGRDALFNSIIQSALPIAQSNAQALQARASQNLSNEQQANLQQATQQQQLRLQNLANRQTAESQTAQMSQQMRVMQSQFRQDAVMTTAQQQQQTRMANLQNQQQAAVINVQNQQAMNAQNLGNEQQINLAELQIEAQVEGANQAAENQERLVEMQVAADFLAKNAAFKQDMERANLSNEQQIRLANLSALNQASSENLNAAQQTELANLNKQMQLNIRNAELAQQMGLAQLNVDQQRAMQNASTVANMDMANFNADQQRVMADSKFMQTVTLSNFNAEQQAIMQNATAMASLDLATADQRTKLAITNAQSFLQMDMANLSNEQQANMLKAQQEQQRLLSNQSAENVANNINAQSENQTNQFMAGLAAQMEQFNVSQMNTAQTFNAQSKNAAAARDADRIADVNKANAAILNDITKFTGQLDFNRNQWNAANEQAIINSNISWRRQANQIDTATENAINSQNVQNAFGLTSSALSFIWNELADQATKDFTAGENAATRKLQAMIAAASSEGDAAKHWSTNFNNASSTIDRIFGK